MEIEKSHDPVGKMRKEREREKRELIKPGVAGCDNDLITRRAILK